MRRPQKPATCGIDREASSEGPLKTGEGEAKRSRPPGTYRLRHVGPATFLAIALTSSQLHAEPVIEPKPGDAIQLFKDGRAKLQAGDYAGACQAFEESQKLQPGVGTLINLADCNLPQGRYVLALQYSRDAVSLAQSTNDGRLASAKEHLASVEARVPKLRLKLAADAPADVTVKLSRKEANDQADAKVVDFSSPIPVDPGSYRVTVRAADCTQDYNLDVKEGESAELTDLRCTPSKNPVPRTEVSSGLSGLQISGIVVGGVGLVGLGVGIGFGVDAINKQSDAGGSCDLETNLCTTQEGVDLLDQALLSANISTGMIVVGGVLLAAGVVMIVIPLALPQNATEPAAAKLEMTFGPSGVGFQGSW